MSYLILARKYRPQTFEEVVGQEHITTTLQNAIKQERIAQSFLFSGGRGIGKTSTARIFAKALNCEKGPAPTPCGKCVSCDEISRSTSLDVLEIDGASNRGIDEIRDLRENVKFKPAHGRFKIYIIDEVHMLTGEAFNALLKTLEEPPPHVKFIFATTEPHKVPLTILSRCQRFHFRRISTKEIVAKLKEVAERENIKVSEKVLFLIARTAESSLRDAESLLEQIASFSSGKVDEEKALFVLGATDEKVYYELIEALASRDVAESLQFIHKAAEEGKDLSQFTKGLMEYFRNLLVVQTVSEPDALIDLDEASVKELMIQRERFTKEEIIYAMTVLQNVYSQMRRSAMPRIYLETAVVKLATREPMTSLAEILDDLSKLEQDADGKTAHLNAPPTASPIRRAEPNTEKPVAKPQVKKTVAEEIAEEKPGEEKPDDSPQASSKASAVTLIEVERHWADVIENLKKRKMYVAVALAEAEPLEVEDSKIIVGIPSEFRFHKEELLESKPNMRLIEDVLKEVFQVSLKMKFVVTEAEREEKSAEPKPQEEKTVPGIVDSAVEIFGGRVVRRK